MKRKSTPTRPTAKPDRPARQRTPAQSKEVEFPIVGIGASAGGLEALDQFLEGVPAGIGMAFVVVQHLDPTRKGMMPELLQRGTGMNVIQVKDRTRVRPGCVYVIPPNKDMSILHGVLHLLVPAAARGLRLPIDFFLRSLALDRKERSIGVILSGMGSDGTAGLRTIKEKGGLVLVQEPATAKFDAMPRSAIDAGLADIVAPPQLLPEKIIAYLRGVPQSARAPATLETKTQSGIEKAIILLRAHTGHDFSLYKPNTLYRRIERRMGVHQICQMAAYIRYLQENSQELDLLFKELLIGVTSFFRNPAAWDQMRGKAIPALLVNRSPGHTLRAWVPGCATGEEAYSLAIVFREAVEEAKLKGHFTLQIFATDLDRDAIDKARQGVFPESIAGDMSAERLERFFAKEPRGHRVRPEIREMVIFAPQNLLMDPPFTKLDILICRNLLIYLTQDMQRKLLPLFHFSLNPGGILCLGSAESIGEFNDLFTPISSQSRLYRKSESAVGPDPVEFPLSSARFAPPGDRSLPPVKPPLSFQAFADQLVLQQYALPTALVNYNGDILYTSGKTGKYLEPAAGKANWNIFAMARPDLRQELARAFQQALEKKETMVARGLRITTPDGEGFVNLTVEPLQEAAPLRGLVLVVFAEVPAPLGAKAAHRAGKAAARQGSWSVELERARQELQASRQDMLTSQEVLKSTNEELQSANEELQSTNEELTTSKEEMQSMNEELQTLNTELQAKVDELSRASSDMKNLLDSTDIATLFLDNHLNVRRFTPQVTKIIKLIPADVGRPITDLASHLRYPELAADAQEVLRTLASVEKPISTTDGRWFAIRIMPYRTLEDRIDGVVITFANITAAKTLEAQLRAKQAGLEKQVEARRRD